ncbi:MAG: ankyrin repeat domain-containing protein [Oligoflexia bacterium]|nr:ankyrin repeat domain-containing protein [Oligoflexia bacterium]
MKKIICFMSFILILSLQISFASASASASASSDELRDAIYSGNLPAVEKILPKEDLNQKIRYRQRSNNWVDNATPLHLAVEYGSVEMVGLLLRNHVDVNARDSFGQTALFKAMRSDRGFDIAKLLLENGADPNIPHSLGITPLHQAIEAVRFGDTRLVELLLCYGAQVNATDEISGAGPLHVAAEHGFTGVIESLLSWGADANLTDKYGHRPSRYVPGGPYWGAVYKQALLKLEYAEREPQIQKIIQQEGDLPYQIAQIITSM